MFDVQKIIIIGVISITIIILIYPRKNTFISSFKVKGTIKGFELDICAKEKNGASSENTRSNHEYK